MLWKLSALDIFLQTVLLPNAMYFGVDTIKIHKSVVSGSVSRESIQRLGLSPDKIRNHILSCIFIVCYYVVCIGESLSICGFGPGHLYGCVYSHMRMCLFVSL